MQRETSRRASPTCAGIMQAVTLVEITYELQSPLKAEQWRALGEFANTYGLRRFRVDEGKKLLSFEYDASRLKETEVVHMLRQARIPVAHSLSKDGLSIQLAIAEKTRVPYTIILGQKEAIDGTVIIRNMNNRSQDTVKIKDLSDYLKKVFAK